MVYWIYFAKLKQGFNVILQKQIIFQTLELLNEKYM